MLRWVLLPGLDGTGRLFRDFLPFVPDPQAIIVRYPDEPSWTLDDHVQHVRRQLPPENDCIVVAESFSTPVALCLLRDVPAIRRMVLVTGFARCPHPLLRFVPIGLVARLRRWASTDALLRMFCLGGDAPADTLDELRGVIASMPSTVLHTRLALLRALDGSKTPWPTDVPILLLRAGRDRLVIDPLVADEGVTMTTIDGPHFLLQARPAECAAAIDAWLARLDGQVS